MNINADINLAISDWGIEEENGLSCVENVLNVNVIIKQYIAKYLSLNRHSDYFWERLKYNLIISNLLDDSMVLSKNEQMLRTHQSMFERSYLSTIVNDDDLELVSYEKKYRMTLKKFRKHLVPSIINIIIHLLKFHHTYNEKQKFKIFAVLLLMSARIIKTEKLAFKLRYLSILNTLNEFLLLNYKINKKFITNLINLKNYRILDENKPTKIANLQKHLSNTLEFLIFDLKLWASKLLPYVNGDVLEQFCDVNNVDIDLIANESDINSMSQDMTESIDEVILKLNKFNQLRKLVICEILTFNDLPKSSYFLSQLKDQLNLPSNSKTSLTMHNKLLAMEDFFRANVKVLSNFNLMIQNLEYNDDTPRSDLEIMNKKDILTHYKRSDLGTNKNEINLETLINKLSSLTTNLKYFEKYHKATEDNEEELHEKILIFNQFSDEINKLKELHQLYLSDLNLRVGHYNNLYPGSPMEPSFSDTTDMQLRSFHNTIIKKRYSLPPQLKSPPGIPSNSSSDVNQARKPKRTSGGLQLGLLTVLEEPAAQNKMHISYDDNYINILPPSSYETYNQDALDQLQSNKSDTNRSSIFTNSRFSINSNASNISGASDMVNLTQVSSVDDEYVNDGLSKLQLKAKLEENLNRLYTGSGSKLDQDTFRTDATGGSENNGVLHHNISKRSFSNELEKALLNKVTRGQ
ncbi:uncharacterized protein PRCAT00000429001 [Priceomyces carsonii]|uniref:uncharacterized protein n=1 Tax=Priceomyces carsonii TaxID=28549 RepID=UPI002ED86D82|nr:unnamed protein product [Priceomyces carsonii]